MLWLFRTLINPLSSSSSMEARGHGKLAHQQGDFRIEPSHNTKGDLEEQGLVVLEGLLELQLVVAVRRTRQCLVLVDFQGGQGSWI